ncbi:hypothetical protein PMAYCL1PPCAC_04793, partial [Pristionchus mayeri]
DGDVKAVDSLVCESTYEYVMKIKDIATSEIKDVPLKNADKFEFFCAAPIDKMCENPNDACSNKCPSFTPGSDIAAASLECDGDKWLIDGQYHVLNTTERPVCKQDDQPNTAAFYIPLDSGDEIRLHAPTNVSCFSEYDCTIRSALDYSDCKRGEDCGVLDYSNGRMRCEDPKKYKLSVTQLKSPNVTLDVAEYMCDGQTGKWKDASGAVTLLDGASVRCFSESDTAAQQPSEFSGNGLLLIIGGFILAIVAFIAIAVLVYCLAKNRRLRKLKGVSQEKWMKMGAPARLKYVQETFHDVTSANVHIVHGFSVLEMLLDTNTEDPEIWEEVYPFMLRASSAMNYIDYNLGHLCARYMYLRAKKIIDENGWVSPKPITKSNHDGLMRTVSIRLLTYCVNDKFDDDPKKLTEDGYRRLGFNAVAQYPHCGMMWRLAPALDANYSHPEDPKRADVRLDQNKFMIRLIYYSKKPLKGLEEADTIPQFGSISDQAMLATAADATLRAHRASVSTMFKGAAKGTAAESTKLLEGIGAEIRGDPGQRLFAPTLMMRHDYEDQHKIKNFVPFHEIIRGIAPADVWSGLTESMMRDMVYTQHSQDARRLRSLIMPEVQQPDEYYMTLRASQEKFREAVEDQTDELWKWFAKRIDVEELKERPVHLKYDDPVPLKNDETEQELCAGSIHLDKFQLLELTSAAVPAAATAAAAAPAAAPDAAVPAAVPAAATPPSPVVPAAAVQTPPENPQ